MSHIVVTGSTRGIGFAMAREFVRRGHRVAVSGRREADCCEAVAALAAGDLAIAAPCDVRQPEQVQALWDQASAAFGSVDIWINNAGQAHGTHRFWDLPVEQVAGVVDANLSGTMHGCHVAVRGMLGQGHGAVYNFTGFGRTGIFRDGMAIYGASKRGVDYFSRGLARELRDTPVIVGQINPGMVVTDMLRVGYDTSTQNPETVRRTYNIMGDLPEDVAPFIVEKVLANTRSGVLINRQPRRRILWRFLSAALGKKRPTVFKP